ncbi:MAG: AAA family ATPase [Alphaproteobacteria bacterium]
MVNNNSNRIRSQWQKAAFVLTVALSVAAGASSAHAVGIPRALPPDPTSQPDVSQAQPDNMPLAHFNQELAAGKIKQVTIDAGTNIATFTEGDSTYQTQFMPEIVASEIDKMANKGVDYTITPPEPSAGSLMGSILPYAMLGAVGLMAYRMFSQPKGAQGFGQAKRARDLSQSATKITFADVAGVDEAVSNLQDIVDFLKDPEKYKKLGAKLPKGTLLVGPPGTGKTLLARAIAGETNVPFLTMNGPDFVELFVGVGPQRVRALVAEARAKGGPCIIFIDEIDVIGQHRNAGPNTSSEDSKTLAALLTEVDGSNEANDNIIYIATTNIPETLDPALTRPGRFTRQVVVPNPDLRGREKILAIYGRKHPNDVDILAVAKKTFGFSGAGLANLWNEAALRAGRLNDNKVTMAHMAFARDKILIGEENRTMVVSDAEKKMTAYHEAGHVVMSIVNPLCHAIEKATIVPRGRALGFVQPAPPEQDAYSKSKASCKAQLNMAMGGRAAEELVFGKENVSNGASGDIKQATEMATAMVSQWGMSEAVGMVAHSSQGGHLGGGGTKAGSEATAATIDREVKQLTDVAYATAVKTLTERKDDLHLIAQALLTYETLSGAEITAILKGEPIRDNVVPFQPPPMPDLKQGDKTGGGAKNPVAANDSKPGLLSPLVSRPLVAISTTISRHFARRWNSLSS